MGYWPSMQRSSWRDIDYSQVLFCMYMDQAKGKVHKHAKREQGQYPIIWTKQAWPIKDLLIFLDLL